jgi:hypothetical protein
MSPAMGRADRSGVTGAPEPSGTPRGRLAGLVVVLALFFVFPLALFVRQGDTEGSTRVAVQIAALVLPATGALVLRLNPDLVPDRAGLADLTPGDWLRLALLAVVLAAVAWWVAGGGA